MQKRLILEGLEIDYCDLHGVWFDSGELERMMTMHADSPSVRKTPGVGSQMVQRLANAAVAGAGFHLGRRMVGGILDTLFTRRR